MVFWAYDEHPTESKDIGSLRMLHLGIVLEWLEYRSLDDASRHFADPRLNGLKQGPLMMLHIFYRSPYRLSPVWEQ